MTKRAQFNYLIVAILLSIPAWCGILSSCSSDSNSDEYTYTLVYEIYWSGNHVECKTVTSSNCITIASFRGTNKIGTVEKGWIEETSAPIRKVSYTKTPK